MVREWERVCVLEAAVEVFEFQMTCDLQILMQLLLTSYENGYENIPSQNYN